MNKIHTTIEIAASPQDVRAKFIDFPKIPTYSPNGFFRSLGPAIPNKPLEAGDKMYNVLDGVTIEPIVLENSPTSFRWQGSLYGILHAEHIFRFEPSVQTQGGTTFVHEETFSGIGTFVMGDGYLARLMGAREKSVKGFESYNRDLKKWCEGSNK